ncbi:GAF domain-containing sensor histidine kinase [Synechococcus sp. BDU 130192]|uniref:GAF domain-containing sensor histidine kinase n=1 Tax=Synechococcus sp. BDU 130192 TaxID=2042059 RepID=UPI000C086DFA|nr:GAF domain-containing sensor histidine kinase [Synechococcus sp. BDU 130192]
MVSAALYDCLEFGISSPRLLARLTAAIARQLQVDWVCLRVDLSPSQSLTETWPTNLADVNFVLPQEFHPDICTYTDLRHTPYHTLMAQGLEAIATVPLPAQQAQGYLWLGCQSQTLPQINTLEALRPPLQLALGILAQQNRIVNCQQYQQAQREIQQLIDEIQDTPKLFQAASTQLQTIFGVEQGGILLLKSANPLRQRQEPDPTDTLELKSSWSELPTQWSLQDCELCQVAWQKAPLVWAIADTTTHPWQSPLVRSQVRSLLFAPLMGGQLSSQHSQPVLGFVILAQRSPRQWLPEEIQTMASIAHQLGRTMIHHQALRQVQSLVEERTSQLKWSLEVQAKLSQQMRHQIQQLRHLNRLKDDFLSTVSHELNTPLATMKLAIKMLKQPGRSLEKQRTYLNILDQELNRESKLIHDLLQLQQAEASEFALKPQRLALGPALSELVQKFQDRWTPLKQLQFHLRFKPKALSTKLQFETDPEQFLNAMSELLTNAGKYATPKSNVTLSVEYLGRSPARIQIRLCNDGAAIHTEEQSQIFDKFRRGTGATAQAIPGTGLGLALVKTIVEHLEGSITVSSDPNPHRNDYRTCFLLDFPQVIAGF